MMFDLVEIDGTAVFPQVIVAEWEDKPRCLPAALAYAASGLLIFPVPRGEKKSHKSAEHSNGRKWGATADPDEIRRDYSRWPNANVGIPTGAENAVWVLEVDTNEGHGVDGLASLQALIDKHDALPPTLQAASPSGSLHFYFNWPDRVITNSASKIAPGIDVRGEGGMVLAPPSVKIPVGVYSWKSNAAIADAPDWLVDLAVAVGNSGGSTNGEREPNADLEAPLEWVAAAVNAIINNDLGWEDWNTRGMAIYGACGGSNEGFPIFDRFSKQSSKYNARTTMERWQSYIVIRRTGSASAASITWPAKPIRTGSVISRRRRQRTFMMLPWTRRCRGVVATKRTSLRIWEEPAPKKRPTIIADLATASMPSRRPKTSSVRSSRNRGRRGSTSFSTALSSSPTTRRPTTSSTD
jgi:hypothetical protein